MTIFDWMAQNMDNTDFVKIDENQVTKKRMFWENGYSFDYTRHEKKSYTWLKFSYDVLYDALSQKYYESI